MSSSAMAHRSARALDLAKRTVHVKIYPTTGTFAERREVLRVLEQFGEVAMFRSHQYNPRTPVSNAFLTLFNTESAAIAAFNQSPIRYRLVPQPPESGTDSLGSTVISPSASPEDEKIFELHVSTTQFDHERYLNSFTTNPLHGPFKPVNATTSYIAASLDEVIAPSLWAPGLKDWETDGAKLVGKETPDSEAGPEQGNKGASIEFKVAERQRRRRQKASPDIMKGIRPFREAYEIEQREKQHG